MVQVLPPKFNIGSQIGQSLGSGLQQGMQQGLQRGQLLGALNKVKALGQKTDANGNPIPIEPVDLITAFMEAGMGIPGSEKYLAPLIPLLANPAMAKTLFGPRNTPNAPGGGGVSTNAGEGAPGVGAAGTSQGPTNTPSDIVNAVYRNGQTNATVPSTEKPGIGLTPGGQQELGGFIPRQKTEEEMNKNAIQFAQDLAAYGKDPVEAYTQGYNIEQARNQQAQANLNLVEKRALQTGKITPEEMPYAMQIFQKYGHLNNPDEIVTSGLREFSRFQNARNSLKNAVIPGFLRGALQKGAAGFSPAGLLAKYLAGGKTRDEALKQIQPSVKDLVNMGFEDEARNILEKAGLSPTEAEEAIFPLSKQSEAKIKSFENSTPQQPLEIKEKNLTKFFKDMVTPETSLLVLRHKLWNEKGYAWEEIGPAIRQAMSEGLELTPQQQAELVAVETDAPKQSLGDIFSGWGRWIDFTKGAK
jgi:hypothetical protein